MKFLLKLLIFLSTYSFSSFRKLLNSKNFLGAGTLYLGYSNKDFLKESFERLKYNQKFFYFFTESKKYKSPLKLVKEKINYFFNPEKTIEKKIYENEKIITFQKNFFEKVNESLQKLDDHIQENQEKFKEVMDDEFEKKFRKDSEIFQAHITDELAALNRQKLILEALKNHFYSKIEKKEKFYLREIKEFKKFFDDTDYVLNDISKYNHYLIEFIKRVEKK